MDCRSGETETILVNGQSYPALTAEEAQTTPVSAWTKPPADTSQKCGPAVIDVEPGKTYRFRTIGGTALSLVTFSFETHEKLTVISADGTTTQPARTDHIQVGPGQRFDFLLATKSRSDLEELGRTWFWIQLQTADRPTNVTYYGILQYNYKLVKALDKVVPAARPTTAPLAIPTDLTNWLEYTLSPKEPNGFPSNDQVSRRVFLSNVQIKENNEVWWAINNHTWTEEDMELYNTTYNDNIETVGIPYLVDIYQNGQVAVPNYDRAIKEHGGWDPRLNVYVARPGEVIDIILLNSPDAANPGYDSHPWHIHGGHVYDIGSGDGDYNAEEHLRKLGDWQPALRDTTYLYKYPGHEDLGSSKPGQTHGWRAWRLKVSISG
jgi:L-ascorbate oxidase